MSLSIDFYIRVFVVVKRSPAEVKFEGEARIWSSTIAIKAAVPGLLSC